VIYQKEHDKDFIEKQCENLDYKIDN